MKVDIAPAVALKEAQAEISFVRKRNLFLAQAVADLQQKLVVKPADVLVPDPVPAPETPADPADENPEAP